MQCVNFSSIYRISYPDNDRISWSVKVTHGININYTLLHKTKKKYLRARRRTLESCWSSLWKRRHWKCCPLFLWAAAGIPDILSTFVLVLLLSSAYLSFYFHKKRTIAKLLQDDAEMLKKKYGKNPSCSRVMWMTAIRVTIALLHLVFLHNYCNEIRLNCIWNWKKRNYRLIIIKSI